MEHGNIEVLEYCRRKNVRFGADFMLYIYSMQNKDKEQALVTLKWLRQHGCDWDVRFCNAAVSNDNLEALKWAISEGCAWDEWTLSEAAKSGNIAIVEYCLQNECPMSAEVCTSAMMNMDHDTTLEVLKLLRKYSCPWDFRIGVNMICFSHFEVMRWAKRNGYTWTWTINEFALLTQRGDVDIIEEVLHDEQLHGSILFVQTEGTVKMNPEVIESIDRLIFLRSSDSLVIEKLKLLRKYGYEWNAQTSAHAAKKHQLLVLQWLHHMKCPMDEDTCTAAVISGNIETLKYAHEVAGCGLSKAACANCFCRVNGLDSTFTEIQEYLKKNDCPIPYDGELDYNYMTDSF